MIRFEGIWLPLITPFRNGELDLPAVRRLATRYATSGLHGLVVCGTTGEPATLTPDERLRVLDSVLDAVAGRIPVIMGIASNDTRAAVASIGPLRARPLAGLLVTSPYYTRPSQAGVRAHIHAIADKTALPIILYNIPYRTGINIDVTTVQALCECPNVVAIKESGGDINQLMDLIRTTRLAVLSGEDHLIFTTLCLGGAGAIAAAAHVHTEMYIAMYSAFRGGHIDEARNLSYRLLPMIRHLFSEPNPGPIKAMLAMDGAIAEELRLPMTSVSERCRRSLIELAQTKL